jgi:hypothetical protein
MVTEPSTPGHHERTVYAGFDSDPDVPVHPGEAPTDLEATGDRPPRAAEISIGTDKHLAFTAIPLYDNIHVLAPLPPGQTRNDLIAEANRLARADRDSLDPFDVPERDRMYVLAVQFVANHVRQVRSGSTIWSRDRSFSDGTLVISERAMPLVPFRLVRLNWAIEHDAVIDVHGHRVFAFRLKKVRIPHRRFIWAPGKGDSFDIAYVLGNLCAILGIQVPEPVAASGDVALQTNQIVGSGRIEAKREAAVHDRMAHLILPFGTHLMPGDHHGVRYWPSRDVNEAVYSLLATASSDLAIPDLKRRWRVKMAASWISLLAVLLAIGGMQLAGEFVGNSSLVRWTGGIAACLFAISALATRKYHNVDR